MSIQRLRESFLWLSCFEVVVVVVCVAACLALVCLVLVRRMSLWWVVLLPSVGRPFSMWPFLWFVLGPSSWFFGFLVACAAWVSYCGLFG